jgi:hypothetical protein
LEKRIYSDCTYLRIFMHMETRIAHILVVSRAARPSHVDQSSWLGDVLKRCNIKRQDAPKVPAVVWGHGTAPNWLENVATKEFGRSIWDPKYYSTETFRFVDTSNAGGRVFVVRQHSERPQKSWRLWQ